MCVTIELNNIAVLANIGVTDSEQSKPQPLRITVSFTYDASHAQHSDDIADAVDYAHIRRDVLTLAATPVRLLEHLAHTIKTTITEQYPVESVHVRIEKPNAFADVEHVHVCN